MFWTFIQKDFLRIRRNPLPYLFMLALPLILTGLIGMAFAPSSKDSKAAFPLIKVAFVDEDQQFFGEFFRIVFQQKEVQKYLQVHLLPYPEAVQQIEQNELSAVLRLPKGFTLAYFKEKTIPPMELLKNPRETILPDIVEEMIGIFIEVLNAVLKTLSEELPRIYDLVEQGGDFNFQKVKEVAEIFSNKLTVAEKFLFPPLIEFQKKQTTEKKETSSPFNFILMILLGNCGLFLCFIADLMMRDLLKEAQMKTLDRIRTLRYSLFSFILSKLFSSVILLVLAGIGLFLSGKFLFQLEWKHFWFSGIVLIAYSVLISGLLGVFISLARNENQASIINSCSILFAGFLGGSMIPVSLLPPFIQNWLSPLLPNYWFSQSLYSSQLPSFSFSFLVPACMLFFGLFFVFLASFFLQRKLSRGSR